MSRFLQTPLLLFLALPVHARADELDGLLEKIDARAAELEAQIGKDSKAQTHVAALVSRGWARRFGRKRAYLVATFSFEHGTRDDRGLVRNDWDVEFGNPGDDLHVRTVTDDESWIWDIGEADFDGFVVQDLTRAQRMKQERVTAVAGHVYVIHTVDSETNSWSKFKVLEATPGTSMIFRWEVISDPKSVMALEIGQGPSLQTGRVVLQLRAGALGGGRCGVCVSGRSCARVDEISTERLDMEGEVGIDESARAFVHGGCIPEGKVWILRRVEYSGFCGEDSNGIGPFVLRAVGRDLAQAKPGSGAFKSEWKGRLVLRPGDEDRTWAEISNSSRCEITFHGILCDEKWADVEKIPELTAEERARADSLLKELDDDDSGVRERAMRRLLDMGPPLAGYVKGLKLDRESADFKARVRDILQTLGGE